MAVCTYTKAEIESLLERIMNRMNSPIYDGRPETQREIKSLCLVTSTLMAHAPVESITIECKRRERN